MKKDDLDFLNKMLKHRDPKIDAFEKKDIWYQTYEEELLDYKYIHTIDEFKTMSKGGIIKVISLKDEKLKKGGVILDIKKNNKNKWYVLVGITNRNILWKIYFDDNYVFFREQFTIYKSNENSKWMRNIIGKFIPISEATKESTGIKSKPLLEELHEKYVLSKKKLNN